MASKDLTYKIGVDSSQGVTGVKQFSSGGQDGTEDRSRATSTTPPPPGRRWRPSCRRWPASSTPNWTGPPRPPTPCRAALGPELAGQADVGSIVGDLQRMGLTFEEIVADADKLAASLKELDQVQVKGLDSGLGGVEHEARRASTTRPAASRSVLANMVGNATQDLGALGGVAGSAGVAIGQMGEYMADAAGERREARAGRRQLRQGRRTDRRDRRRHAGDRRR